MKQLATRAFLLAAGATTLLIAGGAPFFFRK